jgi:hypothetical protein
VEPVKKSLSFGNVAVKYFIHAVRARLRRLERAQAPSFADVLLAIPQDDGEFPRADVHMRDFTP